MSNCPCFRQTMIVACLLFSGSVVIAQDDVKPGRHLADDHGSAQAVDGPEFEANDPHLIFRQRESFVGWMIRCMGPIGKLIPVAGFICCVLTLTVVIKGQGQFAVAALVFLVPIPALLGLFGTVWGMILSLQVIAASSVAPSPSEVSDGIATSLFNPMLGLIAMTPSYLVATPGLFIRSLAKPAALPAE